MKWDSVLVNTFNDRPIGILTGTQEAWKLEASETFFFLAYRSVANSSWLETGKAESERRFCKSSGLQIGDFRSYK
jgi:hypothetical protein